MVFILEQGPGDSIDPFSQQSKLLPVVGGIIVSRPFVVGIIL